MNYRNHDRDVTTCVLKLLSTLTATDILRTTYTLSANALSCEPCISDHSRCALHEDFLLPPAVNSVGNFLINSRNFLQCARIYLDLAHFFTKRAIFLGGSAQCFLRSARSFLGSAQCFLRSARSFLGSARSFLGSARSFLGSARSFLGSAHDPSGPSYLSAEVKKTNPLYAGLICEKYTFER